MSRGALIVLEGCDRTGKSTQCKKLVERLISSGISAKELHFPDRSTPVTGSQINNYLKNNLNMDDHVIHLLFSANRWELEAGMRRDLMSGTTLVIDRYAHSGVAFTAAKKVASVDWCKGPDRGLPSPDVIFYFYLSSEEALKRSGYGEERYEKKSFQEEVARVYEKLRDDSWFDVDASNSIDAIHKQLWDKTSSLLSTINNKEIGKLWTQ